jgi:hypothetical protein
MKIGGGYQVVMDPNAYASIETILGFTSEEETNAWIKDESAAWFVQKTRGM